MTREEEIVKFADTAIYPKDGKLTRLEVNAYAKGIEFGARWADSHPLNPWKSVEELPKHLQSVFVCTTCNNGSIKCVSTAQYDDYYKEWICDDVAYPDYWMPIPELPKENTK